MAKIFVVGDSIAEGIAGVIGGDVQKHAQRGAPIASMRRFFTPVIEAVSSGDTVIVSAGYNSIRGNGLPTDDVTQLQGWIQQLRTKGANVVIVGLRETGMTGQFAAMNNPSNGKGTHGRANDQLRAIARATGATFSEESVRLANRIPNGNIHPENYTELTNAVRPEETEEERRRRNANPQQSGGGISGFFSGIWEFLKSIPIIGGLFAWLESLFTGRSQTSAATPTTATAPTGGRETTPRSTVQTPVITQDNRPLTLDDLNRALELAPTYTPQTPVQPVPQAPAQPPVDPQAAALAATQNSQPLAVADIDQTLQAPPPSAPSADAPRQR